LKATGAEFHGDEVVGFGNAEGLFANGSMGGSPNGAVDELALSKVDFHSGGVVEFAGVGGVEAVGPHDCGASFESGLVAGLDDEVDVFPEPRTAVRHGRDPTGECVAELQRGK